MWRSCTIHCREISKGLQERGKPSEKSESKGSFCKMKVAKEQVRNSSERKDKDFGKR